MDIFQDPLFRCLVPKKKGRLRRDRWGGIYYDRNILRIDLLNDVAFSILRLCDGTRTIGEIEGTLLEEFDAPAEQIQQDLVNFLRFGWKEGYLYRENMESIPPTRWDDWMSPVKPLSSASLLAGSQVLGIEPNVLSAPLKVLIEFTHNCNLKCVHCFAAAAYCAGNTLGYLPGELSAEGWKTVIDQLADSGVFDIFVSGGEPLLRNDILDILARIRDRGMGFCLLTNATLLDNQMAKQLVELGCYKVEANLDGPDARSYDEFRGVEGAFEATVKGIEACLANDLAIRCNVTTTRKNISQLKEIIDTAYRIGVRELCTVPLEPGGRALTNAAELQMSVEDHWVVKRQFEDIQSWVHEKYGKEFTFIGATDLFLADANSEVAKLIDPNRIMPLCGAGRIHCSIAPTGRVILCPAAGSQIPITPNDLLHQDFGTIWREADVFKELRRADIPGCSSCEFINCAGGCHLRTFRKHGKVAVGPDQECRKVMLKKLTQHKEADQHAS